MVSLLSSRRLNGRRHGERTFRRASAVVLLAVVTGLSMMSHAEDHHAVTTVARVDLERYAGDWFEIARFPNRFQRQCTGDVRARYTLRSDGRIDVVNRCRTGDGSTTEARGIARRVDDRTSARLKVRFAPAALSFLPFVWGDYWILGLADDYSWSLVGSPDRAYLWILSRTPHMNADAYASAVRVAAANGFQVDRLVMTSHGA